MTKKITLGSLAALIAVVVFATTVNAATVIVTPTDLQGWSSTGTTAGGQVNFVTDATSPFPSGALQLTTDTNPSASAQYMHGANTLIGTTTNISYWSKTVSGPTNGAPSFQLMVDLNGLGTTTEGVTTLVFSPAQNGTTTMGSWQNWDVDAGRFWSTGSFTGTSSASTTCSVTAGNSSGPFYTLAGLRTSCPDTTIQSFGVMVGTNTPSFNGYVDGIVFGDTTYDFQMTGTSTDTTPPAAPTPLSPANDSTTTTAALTHVDWTDVTDPSSPVTYMYQVSHSAATTSTGDFVSPVFTSGSLSESHIATPNTPEGTYFWHVKATDAAGNTSPWSVTWSFTVDNGGPPPPPPTDHPTDKDQCKNGGWRSFTNPSFRNQGQCVSWVNHNATSTPPRAADDGDDEDDDNGSGGNNGNGNGGNSGGNGNGNSGNGGGNGNGRGRR